MEVTVEGLKRGEDEERGEGGRAGKWMKRSGKLMKGEGDRIEICRFASKFDSTWQAYKQMR